MQLFSPKKAKEQFQTKQQADLAQVGYLKKVLLDLQNRINTENDKFEEMLDKQSKLYADEKTRLQGILRQLEGDIKARAEELKELLKPIDEQRATTERLYKEAEEAVQELKEKEEEAEELTMRFQEKLDELGERELKVRDEEEQLESRKKGIDAEAQQVSESHERLNVLIAQHNARETRFERDMHKRETMHRIEKDNFNKYQHHTTMELEERKRKLIDREQTLERGFKELRNKEKQYGNNS